MQYEVKTISVFERQFKRLAKKYRSLKTDLENVYLLSIYDKSDKSSITDKE